MLSRIAKKFLCFFIYKKWACVISKRVITNKYEIQTSFYITNTKSITETSILSYVQNNGSKIWMACYSDASVFISCVVGSIFGVRSHLENTRCQYKAREGLWEIRSATTQYNGAEEIMIWPRSHSIRTTFRIHFQSKACCESQWS